MSVEEQATTAKNAQDPGNTYVKNPLDMVQKDPNSPFKCGGKVRRK